MATVVKTGCVILNDLQPCWGIQRPRRREKGKKKEKGGLWGRKGRGRIEHCRCWLKSAVRQCLDFFQQQNVNMYCLISSICNF